MADALVGGEGNRQLPELLDAGPAVFLNKRTEHAKGHRLVGGLREDRHDGQEDGRVVDGIQLQGRRGPVVVLQIANRELNSTEVAANALSPRAVRSKLSKGGVLDP